jgi:hypothetical protein
MLRVKIQIRVVVAASSDYGVYSGFLNKALPKP